MGPGSIIAIIIFSIYGLVKLFSIPTDNKGSDYYWYSHTVGKRRK